MLVLTGFVDLTWIFLGIPTMTLVGYAARAARQPHHMNNEEHLMRLHSHHSAGSGGHTRDFVELWLVYRPTDPRWGRGLLSTLLRPLSAIVPGDKYSVVPPLIFALNFLTTQRHDGHQPAERSYGMPSVSRGRSSLPWCRAVHRAGPYPAPRACGCQFPASSSDLHRYQRLRLNTTILDPETRLLCIRAHVIHPRLPRLFPPAQAFSRTVRCQIVQALRRVPFHWFTLQY